MNIYLTANSVFFSKNQDQPNSLIGQDSPDFSLVSDTENEISLKQLLGERVVIYFFIKAGTPPWAKQSCGFRNIYQKYQDNRITVLGISYDKPNSLAKFKGKHNLPFYLLSDENKKVSRLYKANGLFLPKRVTFLIGQNGKVEKVYNKINLETHAEKVLNDILNY